MTKLIRNLKNSGLRLSASLALNRSDTNIKPKIVFKVQAFSQIDNKKLTDMENMVTQGTNYCSRFNGKNELKFLNLHCICIVFNSQ